MHEVSTRRCVSLTISLRWIGTEVCELHHFYGLTSVVTFVIEFESLIPLHQRSMPLDVALKSTPTRWWATHKAHIQDWSQCKRLIHIRFGKEGEYVVDRYSGLINPNDHIVTHNYVWNEVAK